MTQLEIKSITHHFGQTPVLQDVSFSVAASELVCLVGPSGCGKSTLLRLIAGLEQIQSGDILLDGVSINSIPARKRNIGLVFQHPSLFPHLSVRENIMFGLHTLSKNEKYEVADKLLEMIGLTKLATQYPHQLSGGQQQRVALARALAPKPKLMLLDEPFANLDHALRCEIREEVVAVLKATNIPIIMVTHDPDEALIMANKMVLLHGDGRLHQTGEPEAIHNHPVDIEAAGFYGQINHISGIVEGDYISCKLGKLPKKDYVPELPNNTEVIVATRPEGLRIANANESCVKVEVESFRHTGAGWLINASLPDGEKIVFHHIYGHRPQKGDKICLTFDSEHVFVFLRKV